jgi:hypothetical protein
MNFGVVPYPLLEKLVSYFSFVSYGLVTKSLGVGWVHIWGGGTEKQNIKRWMWIFSHSNSDESSHLVSKGAKSLEAITLYNDSLINTISPTLQGQDQQKKPHGKFGHSWACMWDKWSFWVRMLSYSHLTFNTKEPSPTTPTQKTP